jgi:hypothetical protein
MNFDSRWTIAKDVANLAQFLTACFGDNLAKSNATEEEGIEMTVNESKASYPSKILEAFLRKRLPHLQEENPILCRGTKVRGWGCACERY